MDEYGKNAITVRKKRGYREFLRKSGAFCLLYLKRAAMFADKHTQAITAGILAVVLTVLIIPAAAGGAVATQAAITDWGVSFGKENAVPRGNVDNSELKKYDACFMGDPNSKTIWLTFDAGYENGYTEAILDTLAEKNVKAVFFLVSHYLKSRPDLVKRMAEEGHTVANHTATHPDMSKLTGIEALRLELEPVESLYKEITGTDMKKYYRPPQGKFNPDNLQSAKALGYKTVFWSLAYADWDVNNQPDKSSAIRKLNSRIHNGAVVLLHSTSATNAAILGELIDSWREMGYEFGDIDSLF